MLGAIIGDIIGSRFEFNNHRSKDFILFDRSCSFTDDTVCTVAVAEALLHNYSFEEAFRKWCSKYPNPMGGYGAMFSQWLSGYIKGPYNSFGNGSAMRVSPCGWLGDLDLVQRMAIKSAVVTHDHPEGIKGAECITDLIWRLRNQQNKMYMIYHCYYTYNYDVDINLNELRRYNPFNETCQVTVPQAIACFLQSKNFEDCIRNAVSIGGDTDTIAAIAGSLAEAYYGIPDDIMKQAMKYIPDDMKDVINQFYSRINTPNHEQKTS